MKTVLAAIIGIVMALPVQAQMQGSASTPAIATSLVSAGPSGLEYNSANLRAESYGLRGTLETPTMRRQKLAKAIALRDEVLMLQEKDGGVLTERHIRAIQRKSRAIRSYSLIAPGSLAPIRN